ncbi:MAG: hypothetical protein KC609_19090, partial [Myxococcales bacterium]|nr:hypothetical protein [Myxococcales bacterium]
CSALLLFALSLSGGCKGEVFFVEPSTCEHFVAEFSRCTNAPYDAASVARCEAASTRSDAVGKLVTRALACPRAGCDAFNRCLGRYTHHPLATELPERLREQRRAARLSIADDEYRPVLERCRRADHWIAAASERDRKLPRFEAEVHALYAFCARGIPTWLVYVRESFLTRPIEICGMAVLDRMRQAKVDALTLARVQTACAEYHLTRELAALKREIPENLKNGEFNVARCLNPWLNRLATSRQVEAKKVYDAVIDLCYHQLAITLLTRTKAKLDREESQLCDRDTRLIVDEIRIRKLGRPEDKTLLDFFFSLCPPKR